LDPAQWPASAADLDGWAEQVRGHRLWERAVDDPELSAGRQRAADLVAALARSRRDGLFLVGDDPWQDRALAPRIAGRAAWLADALDGEPLSAREVALVLALPYLYDTLWSTLAGRERGVNPHDLTASPDASSDRAAFERFAQTYPQPHRRALAAVARGRRDAAEEIGWWLLHRWIGRQPAAYQPTWLAELGLGPQEDLFTQHRLSELLWALRADPGFLGRTDRPQALTDQAPDGVRERLVGYLLVAARALALEAVALPEVIGEHLGIADPVTADGLAATVRTARWQPRGTSLVLEAECGHPAIEVALRTHIDALNQVLTEIQRTAAAQPALSPLRRLPTHATTDGLRPSTVDGVRAYQSAGVRFRLAEDRVQELLMGEQLYGDPALAIRELYQNALDACRYREARTEFLRRARGVESAWAGQIQFVQGIDVDGRPYLECTDNGIGMGVRELSEVFAQAGIRLGDLPEFLEEQAEWAQLDPPVQLFPNSRFGIGVLSYFMLADEITVDTCRLGRDGRPGARLRVEIAGPGSLFRIRTLDQGEQAGTTVRLHLRPGGPPVSCVDTLRSVLWVADFATEAEHGAQRQTWRPGELSDATPPAQSAGKAGPGAGLVADPSSGVWWCSGEGAILADGLWAGREFSGAVVNLSRDLAPRLSVDRTKILAHREEDVERLLWQAIGALTDAGPAVLTYPWLYSLTHYRPLIADVVFDRALAAGYRFWDLAGDTVDAAVAGCFPPDAGTLSGPDELVEWRLTALAAAGRHAKLVTPGPDWASAVRARPSDALMLSYDTDGTAPWLDPTDIVPLAHLVRAARRIGRSASEIAGRLAELGFNPAVGHETVGTDPDDLVFSSRDADGSRPWLDTESPVTLPYLLKAAHRTNRPVLDVVARLQALGYTVDIDVATMPLEVHEPDDLVVLSNDLDSVHPWLDPAVPVTLLHVLRAAHRLKREASAVAARLAALGYQLADGCAALHTENDDLVLLSRDIDGVSPWLDRSEPVSPMHLLRAAERTGRTAASAAERLRSFGLAVPSVPTADVELTPRDLQIGSRELGGAPPWLDPTRPVSTVHILRAAEVTAEPVGAIVSRLRQLGLPVDIDPDQLLVDALDPDDAVMNSVDLDGVAPWLDITVPVPAMHVLRAARATGRDIHDIAARLTIFGYTVSNQFGELTTDQLTRDDLIIMSRDLDGADPWWPPDERIFLPHLLHAARRTHRAAAEIAARLRTLGFAVDADLDAIDVSSISSADLLVASKDLDAARPWLDPQYPVSMSHLVAASNKLHRPLGDIATRLRSMGYPVPDFDVRLPRTHPGGA
jgi:hypothetical protein